MPVSVQHHFNSTQFNWLGVDIQVYYLGKGQWVKLFKTPFFVLCKSRITIELNISSQSLTHNTKSHHLFRAS